MFLGLVSLRNQCLFNMEPIEQVLWVEPEPFVTSLRPEYLFKMGSVWKFEVFGLVNKFTNLTNAYVAGS